MSAIKSTLARKAVKTTAKHSAHGATAKLRRQPLRAATLLGLGVMVGVLAGWAAGRSATGEASVGTAA